MAAMKRYGTLYLIPSMIGESLPAKVIPGFNVEVIRGLKYFIVEEIRSARRFLKRICPEIDQGVLEFLINNEHSAVQDFSSCIEPLLAGSDMGLLSEAGMPCIADPGGEIVKLAHQYNIRVIPLVGPSSLLLSLMASGFNGQNFVFHGYLPIDKISRAKKIREIERSVYTNNQTQLFIEAPYRNLQLLQSLTEVCNDNTRLCIATDLTMDSEIIKVQSISHWKGKNPDIHKKPTVFLLYK
jgi:16S rRNA (cytidine1402-2'-O)-methyltransferase